MHYILSVAKKKGPGRKVAGSGEVALGQMSNSGHLVWTARPVSFHQATQGLTWPTHTASEDKEAGYRLTWHLFIHGFSQVLRYVAMSSRSAKR